MFRSTSSACFPASCVQPYAVIGSLWVGAMARASRTVGSSNTVPSRAVRAALIAALMAVNLGWPGGCSSQRLYNKVAGSSVFTVLESSRGRSSHRSLDSRGEDTPTPVEVLDLAQRGTAYAGSPDKAAVGS